MKTFKDLEFNQHPMSTSDYEMGIQSSLTFDNGWGVSVVKGPHTYGGNKGLYELAVFKDGEIHYDNKIANGDVVGYLRPEDVTDAMLVIQKY
jgi:hypothetical protein